MPSGSPRYPLINATAIGFIGSLVVGSKRSFAADSVSLVSRLRPPLRVEGQLPDLGSRSWLLVVNHFHRPWFPSWWISIAVTAVAKVEVHWIMTSTWTFPDRFRSRCFTPLLSRLFARLAWMYSFTSMPPMPPSPEEARSRAHAVRTVLQHVDQHPQTVVGMAPEGRDSSDGRLVSPPPGVGRFAAQLAKRGLAILPFGVYEAGSHLCVHPGVPFDLPDVSGPPGKRDLEASELIMRAIAACIPVNLRGTYG